MKHERDYLVIARAWARNAEWQLDSAYQAWIRPDWLGAPGREARCHLTTIRWELNEIHHAIRHWLRDDAQRSRLARLIRRVRRIVRLTNRLWALSIQEVNG